MDIKIHGLTEQIIREANCQDKRSKNIYFDKIMAPVISEVQKKR